MILIYYVCDLTPFQHKGLAGMHTGDTRYHEGSEPISTILRTFVGLSAATLGADG
jgi:hypothetical protein